MNDTAQSAFNAKRKARAAVYAVIATQELHHRLACRARHAAVFTDGGQHCERRHRQQAKEETVFDPRRKFRAAVYVVLAAHEIQHWIDSEETLWCDPTLHQHGRTQVHEVDIPEPRAVGEKFNPRRTFRAAVYAVIAVNELRVHSAKRQHVKEMLAWLGQHTTRPSFVQKAYQDATYLTWWPSRNPKRKLKSAVLAVMAVNKFQKNLNEVDHKEVVKARVKERLDWLAYHIPDQHPQYVHFTTTEQRQEEDETEPAVPHHCQYHHHDRRHRKDFEAMRKAIGDTVVAPHTGMLHYHEYRRAKSTE
mmetsp:Transcript_8895/g.14273  ORF Transcript_8895/g.14273 Transcript_8895/m.14273 type:complete len:305 (-) Transcript_8895:377-1291(-)|eukprot:CAMPEP_0178753288 /NCGR_PEP_ID=MMETSP0744-20121128/11530_1 /TAXON_ID=913974 /ORGANISM="Nitzschia punctata, Strain CCMP561" /LENGTH=304 /DNA_ID=CAMNT_0020407091 /DNA_START=260 /DNA_END=1174 /DNA_ORIENTATION=+